MHSATTFVPRRFLLRLGLIPVAKWLVPACRCFALPVAVNRKRFFVPLCVFCFGIVRYSLSKSALGKALGTGSGFLGSQSL